MTKNGSKVTVNKITSSPALKIENIRRLQEIDEKKIQLIHIISIVIFIDYHSVVVVYGSKLLFILLFF